MESEQFVSSASVRSPAGAADLSAAKRKLLELRLTRQARERPRVPRRADVGSFPLSSSQERLWFFEQFEPGSPVYNCPRTLRLLGPLKADVLARSFSEVLRRHEVLRARFESVDGRPLQTIVPAQFVVLPVIDLEQVPEAGREAEALRLAKQDAARPFDLAQGPLFRAALFRLSREDHILLVNVHHIAFDGWSNEVFKNELLSLYEAFAAGKPSPLAEPAIQFADFADWQNRALGAEQSKGLFEYWKRHLRNAPPFLELPTDHPRPATRTFKGACRSLLISKTLSESIKALSQNEGATFFMTLFAAFQTLLHRYSRQDDILVGVPVAGRSHLETEGLIGCFINTVVLRMDFSGEPTFKELIQRARRTSLDAFAHQDLPFERVVEAVQPIRDASRSPLFQVMFQLRNIPKIPRAPAELKIEPVEIDAGASKVDLSMDITEKSDGLDCRVEYSTDLFEDATIARMLAHFQTLLEDAVCHPEKKVSELALLSESERHRIVVEWNNTTADFPLDQTYPELFEKQVRATPHAVAVQFRDKQLTFEEFNRRANLLAGRLRSLGVGPDIPVAICIDRSLEMAIGLLGILKAGGAYVPLDPLYPKERLAFMLRDSGAPVIVTQRSLVSLLPAGNASVLCLDEMEMDESQDSANLPFTSGPENLAYIIYTSGSTGTPKGVAITHRSMVNHNQAVVRWYEISPKDRSLQFASISFDLSVEEIFPTWLAGGAVVFRTDESIISIPAFFEFLTREKITLFNPPTAYWHEMVSFLDQAPFPPCIRLVILGGERATETAYAAWKKAKPAARLFNGYGPTETTVSVTLYVPGPHDQLSHPDTLPIGKPLSNVRAYILDRQGQPVPIGVPGELCIGGVCVARGYLNRPELTAEKFVPDPFAPTPGGRMYKSGDLARWLPDGNIEFVGRMDTQVKIRGFRIEPAEIETVLRRHPLLKDAAVTAVEQIAGNLSLVAHAVPAGDSAPTPRQMADFLREKLPAYMVPSHYLLTNVLPLTDNGKVDRKALSAAASASFREAKSSFLPPGTATEKKLAQIWMDVLGVSEIGLEDDFFGLGGHSLLAMRMMALINKTFAAPLTLLKLFQNPTLGAMASALDRQTDGAGDCIHALVRTPGGQNAPLSFAQQRLWFLNQLDPGSPAYHISHAVRLQGPLSATALKQSLDDLVGRHETLRTVFPSSDGTASQKILPQRPFPLEEIDLRAHSQSEREARVQRETAEKARHPFNLENGPLARGCLMRMAENEYILLLTMHHIISDGWSMDLLFKELSSLYEAHSKGYLPVLAELPVQYADFSRWQRRRLEGEVLDRQLDYWKKKMAGAPALLELPTDQSRPPLQTFKGRAQTLVLAKPESEALRNFSQSEGATLFMTLLAAFQILLHRWSGQDDLVVGAPIAGRTHPDVENLIGLFLNTLPFRGTLSGNPTFRQWLAQVRETALEAYGSQDVPFETIVEKLQPDRNLSFTPIFQVMLNLFHFSETKLKMPGLKIEHIPVPVGSSKFDMTLYVDISGEMLHLRLVYNSALFSAERMIEFLAQLHRLLLQILANPDSGIDDYDLITDTARLFLPDPAEPLEEPKQIPIVERFLDCASHSPDSAAVSHNKRTFTYRELERNSLAIASELGLRGLKRGQTVAISGKRSFGLVASALGALMAGGKILLLDNALPAARRRLMIEQAETSFFVGVGARAQESSGGFGSSCAFLEVDPETGRSAAMEHPSDSMPAVPVPLRGDDPAYVFFTSGTTATPKGVVGTHKGLSHFLDWQRECFDVSPTDRSAQLTALSFDVILRDLFLPLTSGATLCLPPFDDLTAENVLSWLEDEKITLLHTVPALAQSWLASMPHGISLKTLRYVFFAGEPLTDTLIRRWRQCFPEAGEVVNLYGPTETTLAKCYYRVPDDLRAGIQSVGFPLPQTQALVMNRNGGLCGICETGEIVIRTPFRTAGYLSSAGENGARFIRNPFHSDPADLLYKTGDRGRYLPDGSLEILGRLDDQVKIRGVRVEPAEVTAVLAQHPNVKACLVVSWKKPTGENALAVYLTVARQTAETTEQLRAYLSQHLTAAMVPSVFVHLDHMPLSANGKIDRRALPPPVLNEDSRRQPFIAPSSPIELALAEIWSKILGVSRIGVKDNFFELGGHSLLAIQIISRVNRRFEMQVPLRKLFENPTICALALTITRMAVENLDAQERTRLLADLEDPKV